MYLVTPGPNTAPPRSHSSPRFPPGREEFHGGFRGGPGYRGREGRREDRRDGREFKRPCKFWMDRGR